MAPSTGREDAYDYDLIVVGGGPVGSEVGRIVARRGLRVAILEEHGEVGRPVQCGGLVSGKVLRITGYKDTMNSLKGADIYSPGGRCVSFTAPEPRAHVLDRQRFDGYMADRAVSAGCDLRLSTKVMAADHIDGPGSGVSLKATGGDGKETSLTSRILVGADGIQGGVSRWFKLARPREVVSGYEVFFDGVDTDPEKAVVVSGRGVAPGFFGWAIPLGPARALVGLGVHGVERPASAFFEDMVGSGPMAGVVKGGRRGEALAGCIPMGIVGRTYTDNVMVVGDAAAQVKPLSGGGLYTGLIAAKHCGRVAAKALEEGDCSRRVLREYEDLWQHSIGKELKNGALLRRLYLNLSDEQVDQLVEIINDKALLPLIVDYGDIDSPSILAKVMLKRAPGLLRFTGPLLRALL